MNTMGWLDLWLMHPAKVCNAWPLARSHSLHYRDSINGVNSLWHQLVHTINTIILLFTITILYSFMWPSKFHHPLATICQVNNENFGRNIQEPIERLQHLVVPSQVAWNYNVYFAHTCVPVTMTLRLQNCTRPHLSNHSYVSSLIIQQNVNVTQLSRNSISIS